jgi:hypothetical protein
MCGMTQPVISTATTIQFLAAQGNLISLQHPGPAEKWHEHAATSKIPVNDSGNSKIELRSLLTLGEVPWEAVGEYVNKPRGT